MTVGFPVDPKLPVEKKLKKTQVLTFLILLVKMHYKNIKEPLLAVALGGNAYCLSSAH
jgi:hypothetical protein